MPRPRRVTDEAAGTALQPGSYAPASPTDTRRPRDIRIGGEVLGELEDDAVRHGLVGWLILSQSTACAVMRAAALGRPPEGAGTQCQVRNSFVIFFSFEFLGLSSTGSPGFEYETHRIVILRELLRWYVLCTPKSWVLLFFHHVIVGCSYRACGRQWSGS